MSSEDFDLAGDVEQAWTRFRGRLADRIAAMEDDECFLVEMEVGVGEDDLDGAAPYLQYMGWGGDLVRAEVVSNYYLDERFSLTDRDEVLLDELGWLPPTYDPDAEADSGSANFYLDLEVREADRLAVISVRVLREVFGCAHPIFLSAEGLELDPPGDTLWAPATEETSEVPTVEFPESRDELRTMVDRALAVMFTEPLRHDDEGDVPIITGRSAVFVRVAADAPFVELYSELVVEVAEERRGALEVGILNRDHPYAKFHLRDDVIVMTHRICAFPFVASQLRGLLARLMEEIDNLARDVAARVDGRRFFDPVVPPAAAKVDPVEAGDRYPSLVGLLEMLYDGPAEPAQVAALFDNDRHEVIRQLVRLRTGSDRVDGHDLEMVLGQLRAALRFIADASSLRSVRRPLPPKPARSHQPSLLPEGEDTLDVGLWSADLE